MPKTTTPDVIVFGGGLAGLTAALQLKHMRPTTRIVVIEKRRFPVREAAFKVGESLSEIGAHYMSEAVGFGDHLKERQMRKFSMRMFCPFSDNSDIARRPEIGLCRFGLGSVYQVDRGRLENALAAAVASEGIELLHGRTVVRFATSPVGHTVTVRHNGQLRDYTAKWIIDASGRAGIVRRNLGLTVDIPHDVNASWFRLPYRLLTDEWSDNAAWRARVPNGKRWMGTNHLLGEGYWVWLIPLPDDRFSVGVVADPRFVPFERIRRYEALLDWARQSEPQLASHLPASEADLLDFRKVKNYAYATRRGLSPQRWCLTGEAALFLDPLYATGFDFIALANTLATQLIYSALENEPDLKRRLKAYNGIYMGQFVGWEPAFAGQYEVFRDPQATAAKVLWDNSAYFMYSIPLFTNGCMTDYKFMASVADDLKAHFSLNVYMQRLFRAWSAADIDRRMTGFPIGSDAALQDQFEAAVTPLSKPEVYERVKRNTRRIQAIAWELYSRVTTAGGLRYAPPPLERPRLDPDEEQIVEWSRYDQRMLPPEQTERQPPGSWMIR